MTWQELENLARCNRHRFGLVDRGIVQLRQLAAGMTVKPGSDAGETNRIALGVTFRWIAR